VRCNSIIPELKLTVCRECFLREDELEAALTAFQQAKEKARLASGKEAADAFIAATEKALNGVFIIRKGQLALRE
jgi:hypothetical protein